MLPSPETMGWLMYGGKLVPILKSLEAVPEACIELIKDANVKLPMLIARLFKLLDILQI